MNREKLSVFVTTLNNAETLEACLAAADWADELVVLDSGSTDDTLAIAQRHGARCFVEPFKGYGPQKASAMAKVTHRWALLLDADEVLTPPARAIIEQALVAPEVAGFRLRRREQVFWRLHHPAVRHARMLRLIDTQRARFGDDPIHAAPEVDGPVRDLAAVFVHYGEPDIHTKVDKINRYSTGMVAPRRARRWLRARMIVQPPWHFLRQYVGKRKFLSGWAGFIGSVIEAFYVFLKNAKIYEAQRRAALKRDERE